MKFNVEIENPFLLLCSSDSRINDSTKGVDLLNQRLHKTVANVSQLIRSDVLSPRSLFGCETKTEPAAICTYLPQHSYRKRRTELGAHVSFYFYLYWDM